MILHSVGLWLTTNVYHGKYVQFDLHGEDDVAICCENIACQCSRGRYSTVTFEEVDQLVMLEHLHPCSKF